MAVEPWFLVGWDDPHTPYVFMEYADEESARRALPEPIVAEDRTGVELFTRDVLPRSLMMVDEALRRAYRAWREMTF